MLSENTRNTRQLAATQLASTDLPLLYKPGNINNHNDMMTWQSVRSSAAGAWIKLNQAKLNHLLPSARRKTHQSPNRQIRLRSSQNYSKPSQNLLCQQQKFFNINIISPQNTNQPPKLVTRSTTAGRAQRSSQQRLEAAAFVQQPQDRNLLNLSTTGAFKKKHMSLAIRTSDDELVDYGHLELVVSPQKEQFQRRSPMFTIKKIEPMKKPGSPDQEQMLRLRKQEMTKRFQIAARTGLIFDQHEKTSVKARKVSAHAGQTYNRMSVEIDSCRATERLFFDARRSIAEAANKIAVEHNIDLQLMDEEDSDEERTNFFEGRNSTQDSSAASAYYSSSNNGSSIVPGQPIAIKPWKELNDRPMLKASRARNKVQMSFHHEPPRRFYNSVNRNFISSQQTAEVSIENKTKPVVCLAVPSNVKKTASSHYSSKN